jgi:hypothetical protein
MAFSKCHALCHYAEWHFLNVMLNVIMLNVIMLNVIVPNVVAPTKQVMPLGHLSLVAIQLFSLVTSRGYLHVRFRSRGCALACVFKELRFWAFLIPGNGMGTTDAFINVTVDISGGI